MTATEGTVTPQPQGEFLPRSLALWSVLGYVSLAIIRPWDMLFPELGEIHFERIYALTMIGLVILGGRARFRLDLQTLAILLFTVCLSLSARAAWNREMAWEELYEYLTLVVFYMVMVSAIRSEYELSLMVLVYIASMAAYLAKAQWEYFVHGAVRYDMGVTRMWGIEYRYGYPNGVAASCAISLPFLLFLWSRRRHITTAWPWLFRKLLVPFCGGYFLLAVTSIILTNSRMGMLACVCFAGLVVLRGKGLWGTTWRIGLGCILLGLVWIVMPEESRGRLRTVWDPSSGPLSAQISAEGRWEGLEAGIEMFREYPWLGVGVGNFTAYRTVAVDGVALNAHNLLGQALGEAGLVGALGFALLLTVCLWNCRRIRIGSREGGEGEKTLSALATAVRDMILLLLFCGLVGHNMYRFHWLWAAAFGSIGAELVRKRLLKKEGQQGKRTGGIMVAPGVPGAKAAAAPRRLEAKM